MSNVGGLAGFSGTSEYLVHKNLIIFFFSRNVVLLILPYVRATNPCNLLSLLKLIIDRLFFQDENEAKTTKTVIVGEDGKPTYIQHVPVPSQKDVRFRIIDKFASLMINFLPPSERSLIA